MLLIKRTGVLIVAGNPFDFFTGFGIVKPILVDLSDFSRSFREERNTTIKIYLGHQNPLVSQVYNVIKRHSGFDIWTTIWYKFIFRMQNKMNWRLCRIKSRDMVFILIARYLLQGKIIQFWQNWALNSDLKQVLMRNFTSGWVHW